MPLCKGCTVVRITFIHPHVPKLQAVGMNQILKNKCILICVLNVYLQFARAYSCFLPFSSCE